MLEPMTKAVRNLIVISYLLLIFSGTITSPDQIPGEVNSWDLQCLGGTIMKENGYCTEKCCMLTGVVVLNRLHSDKWDGDTIEEVVTAKDSGYWQYAYSTRRDFRTVKCTPRVLAIAKYLLIFYEPGLQAPENLIYQGMNKHAGSNVYWTDGKGEYFCYE